MGGVKPGGRYITLTVQDNGQGFETSQAQSNGIGLYRIA